MPQHYTPEELQAMNPEELRTAQAAGFVKPETQTPLVQDAVSAYASPPSPPQSYEATAAAWLSGDEGHDFTTPSGKLCRVRDLPVDRLAAEGILDQLTRLPGLADEQVRKANGEPPQKAAPPDMREFVKLLNTVVPMLVVKPEVFALPEDGEERQVGRIYVDSISLQDRIAILNQASGAVMAFDNFRE